MEAPSAEAATAVHKEAHGLAADEVIAVFEGTCQEDVWHSRAEGGPPWHAWWVRTAGILAALALFTACSAAPPDAGRLVITGNEGEVVVVDPDTEEREELSGASPYPGPVQPTASRDGRVVVWTGATSDGRPVVKVNEAGDEREIEVPTFPFFYSFDADSSTVAALGNDPDGGGVALVLIDLADDTARIVDSGDSYYLDWHPREPTVAVHVGFSELAVLEGAEGREPIGVQTGDFQAPAWTEDGRVVASVRSEGATASRAPIAQASIDELAVVDLADDSYERVAVVEATVNFDVAEDRIAYVEGAAGPLRVLGTDGEGPVEVSGDDVVTFEWSPAGDLLMFLVFERDVGLVPHVWDGEEVVEYPAFQPTGVFVTQYLPFWSQYARTITQWAPDGSAFTYADGSEEPTVWVQPREGERREIGPGVMVTWSP